MYASYGLLVDLGARQAAARENDIERRTVDILLYGNSGEYMRTAALSLDGEGLRSYGEYFVTLRSVCIAYRAAVLEENGYTFVRKHSLTAEHSTRPPGYLATWEERGKLAAVKCLVEFQSSASEDAYARLLLLSEGKRNADRFMEVHIYGGFNREAFEDWRKDGVVAVPVDVPSEPDGSAGQEREAEEVGKIEKILEQAILAEGRGGGGARWP